VDGIHFDDYFYPYPVDGVDFPDDATYNEYLAGGGTLARDDWRRDNVNRMIQRVYSTIKTMDSGCVFSISPFGLYRPGHPEGIPSPIAGLDPYSAMYADAKYWLQMGWMDAMAPQIYWAIDPPAQSYPVIVDWWLDNNPVGRHVYPANGVYKIADSNNWPVSEITNQVDLTRDDARRAKECLGNMFYSAKYFRDNTKGIYDVFRDSVSQRRLLPWTGWRQRNRLTHRTSLWEWAPSRGAHKEASGFGGSTARWTANGSCAKSSTKPRRRFRCPAALTLWWGSTMPEEKAIWSWFMFNNEINGEESIFVSALFFKSSRFLAVIRIDSIKNMHTGTVSSKIFRRPQPTD
jgi:hypothetical protein